MENKEKLNIIIAGIGGQGVYSLTQVIWNLCAKNEYPCTGSTFKGGAQKAGSIHSELRVFLDKNIEINNYSNQIRKGTLDLIIGLEPWETLRYATYFNSSTKVIMNTAKETLFIERIRKEKLDDPLETLRKQINNIFAMDFSSEAIRKFNDFKMLNYLMLMESIKNGYLPFTATDAHETFLSTIKQKTG